MPSRPRWSTGAAVMQWVVTRLRAGKADWICLFFMAYAWFFQLRQKMLSCGFSCPFITIYLTIFHSQSSWSALPHRGFESSHACMHTEYAGIYTRKKKHSFKKCRISYRNTTVALYTHTQHLGSYDPNNKKVIPLYATEKAYSEPCIRNNHNMSLRKKRGQSLLPKGLGQREGGDEEVERERKKSRDKTKMRNGVGEEVIIYYLLRL